MQDNPKNGSKRSEGTERKEVTQEEVIDGLPDCYLRSASQITEQGGAGRLRVRNSMIHNDLMTLARERNTNVTVRHDGNRTWYSVDGMGIVVSLANA